MQGKLIVNASVHRIIDDITGDDNYMVEDKPVQRKDHIYSSILNKSL